MYINKLDDIINKYNKTNHTAVKIKPVYVNLLLLCLLTLIKKILRKTLNLKLVIM